MKKLITLEWLVDDMTETLAKMYPVKSLKYLFDDGVETVEPEKHKGVIRGNIMVQLIHAITGGEINLLNAYGMKHRNTPEPLTAIKTCAVSPDDAEKIKAMCGLADGSAQQEEPPFPRENDTPLIGGKAIAKECGLKSTKQLDRWRKKYLDLPISKTKSGKIIALQSELRAWLMQNK